MKILRQTNPTLWPLEVVRVYLHLNHHSGGDYGILRGGGGGRVHNSCHAPEAAHFSLKKEKWVGYCRCSHVLLFGAYLL